MSPAIARWRALAVLLGLAAGVPAVAQVQPLLDRREWLAPGAPTTDDPRRTPASAMPKGPPGVTVLRGGRVFDAVRAEAYPATVVLQHNRIQAVLPPDRSDWPAEARVIDVTGKTVMPGLIDLHVHLTYPNPETPIDEQASEGAGVLRGMTNLRYFLESGFTSVRDMGGVYNSTYLLSEWMQADKAPGPRIFATGHIITGTGGHAADRPISATHSPAFTREADGPDDWRKAVRETFKQGASVIKVASLFSRDEIKAAVEEAHSLGLRVACDCETIYTQWAVEAGVDDIEHPLPRTDETIRQMARRGTVSVPTLQVYQNVFDGRGSYAGAASRRFSMDSQQNFDLFKKMKAAGIKMGIGTDTIGRANEQTPNNYIAELKWFVKGGYSPAEALTAATRTNAEILDMADKLGTLRPGMLADVIVVDGKPDIELDDLRKVSLVIRDGYVVVDQGRVFIPRHEPAPLAKRSPPATTR